MFSQRIQCIGEMRDKWFTVGPSLYLSIALEPPPFICLSLYLPVATPYLFAPSSVLFLALSRSFSLPMVISVCVPLYDVW